MGVGAAAPARAAEVPGGPPSYTLVQTVPAKADDVLAFFSDPQGCVESHPLMVSARVLESQSDGQGRVQDAVIEYEDSLKCGVGCASLRHSFKYRAKMHVLWGARKITFAVDAPGLRSMFHLFIFEDDGVAKCEVTDIVYIDVHWMLRSFVVRTARDAHEKTLKAMAEHFADTHVVDTAFGSAPLLGSS